MLKKLQRKAEKNFKKREKGTRRKYFNTCNKLNVIFTK